MKILVLGTSGFIGYNTYEYFHNKGHDILCPDRTDVDLLNEKEVNYLFSSNPEIDVVFQLAASTTNSKDVVERPWIHVTNNAVMNSYIFKAAHEAGVKHVIFPSCTTMYPGALGRRVKEEDFDRDSIFPKYFGVASTKVYIEDMCKFWASLGKTKFTAIRHSNIYGPYDRFDQATAHVCGATIKKVLDSSPDKPIEIWGDGSEVRDLLYVDDLMDAFDKIIEKQTDKYDLLNVGYGEGTSVLELTSAIRILANKNDSPITFNGKAPTLKFDLVLDYQKILKKYGWKPTTDIYIGLNKAINWYKEANAISNPL
jgi:nucleoside-diphosphate-sugar epimerase